ncbi:MAG: hypothetical protein HYY94_00490, partial [Gemmatimonadetes bacterium]|nr:hypothetical protein [Gemmatimonadota bacterium]
MYRDERISAINQQQRAQLGYFLAEASTPDRGLRHSGFFRRLIQGEDYLVHSSGLWLVLRSPLREEEALAIAYVTEAGDTVGTFNAEQSAAPRLRLLRGPTTIHQPGQATWKYEMHQVYRLDSSNSVELGSVELRISLGELVGGVTFKEAAGQQVQLLRLLGLDEDAPVDQLDRAQIYQPARSSFGEVQQSARIGGTYIVFPTIEPFKRPPPVPSLRLT